MHKIVDEKGGGGDKVVGGRDASIPFLKFQY